MTEWREFASPEFARVKEALAEPAVFDARNLFDTKKVLSFGFSYYSMGKTRS